MTTVRFRQLQTALGSGRPSSDPEVKQALVGLASEVRERLTSGSQESRDFFISVAESIQDIRGNAHAQVRADCLFDCCQYLYLTGDTLLALLPAREVIRLRQITGVQSDLRRAIAALGILCADTGSIGEALEHYSTALQMSRAMSDLEAEATIWTNLSTAFGFMSRYHEAITCGEQVRCLAPASPMGLVLVKKAAHNMSLAYFNLGDFQRARTLSEFAVADATPEDAGALYSRVNREHHYIEVLLELGEFDLAQTRLSLQAQYAAKANTARAKTAAMVTKGLLDAFCGNPKRAVGALEALIASSAIKTIPTVVQDVLRALTRACEKAGESEKALGYLQEMVKFHQQNREQGALARLAIAGGATSVDFRSKVDLAEIHQRQASLRAKLAENELLQAEIEVLERLAVTADLREEETGEHGYRVGRLAGIFAGSLSWSTADCEGLECAARLHDIGKIGIPERILFSSGKLQESERNLMSAHAAIGAELLSKSSIGQLRLAEEIARHHHEWWDGTGYPTGLAGKRIPLSARIVALADVFDALTHGRTYEKPWSKDSALAHIEGLRGRQFDPELTDRFVGLVQGLIEEHPDLDGFLGRGSRSSGVLQARDRIRAMLDGSQARSTKRQFDLATSKS